MSRDAANLQSHNQNVQRIAFSFRPAGNSGATPLVVKGKGVSSVVRTGQSAYQVTLVDTWADCLHADVALQLASGATAIPQLGAIDVKSAKTIAIRVMTVSGAAAAEIADDPNNRIHVELELSLGS